MDVLVFRGFGAGLMVLALLISSTGAAAIDPASCTKLLVAKTRLRRLREHRPARISRRRSYHIDGILSLRVISRGLAQDEFSPRVLVRETVNAIHGLRDQLSALGFGFHSYLQVLVGAHSGSIATLKKNDDGSSGWEVRNEASLLSDGPMAILDERGKWLPIPIESDELYIHPVTKILILNPVSATTHAIADRVGVARALAQVTENPTSHRSGVWLAERADFLAYVLTGAVQDSGPIYLALYDISQQFNLERALQFIRWMDNTMKDVLPEVPSAEAEEPRVAVGQLMRRWANFQFWHDEDKKTIETILSARGI